MNIKELSPTKSQLPPDFRALLADKAVFTESLMRVPQRGFLMVVVLLVADNEVSRDRLSRRLQRRGCAIEVANDGGEAVRLAGLLRPDIIVIDLANGQEVARQMRADAKTNSIPIIAMTEQDTEPGATGFDACETKPVNLDRLLVRMEVLLSREISVAAGGETSARKKKQ